MVRGIHKLIRGPRTSPNHPNRPRLTFLATGKIGNSAAFDGGRADRRPNRKREVNKWSEF